MTETQKEKKTEAQPNSKAELKKKIKTEDIPHRKKKSILNMQVGGVSKMNVALSMRQMGLMLKSGLAISEVLKTMSEQSTDKLLSETYYDVWVDVEAGNSLAESMKKHKKIFTYIITSIVQIGEQAGSLERNLLFLADYLKKEVHLERKVRGALIYPIIIIALTIVEMLGVIFIILPKLEGLFSTFENIPPFTQFVLDSTGFIRENIIVISISLLFAGLVANTFSKTKVGKIIIDKILFRAPVIKNLIINTALANLSRTFAILMESSIPIVKAIRVTSTATSNYEYAQVLKKIQEEVKEGQTLTETFTKYPKHFPFTYTKMVSVGERTGTLEENFFYLFEYYEDEVENMADNLTNLIEPILLIFIGLMIGLLAITIIGPIYQLTGSINA